ncbi:MAG: hypothetical protein ACQESS_02950 [Bacillota bacterium]
MKLKVSISLIILILLFTINIEASEIYLGSFAPREDESYVFTVPFYEIEDSILAVYTENNFFSSDQKVINSAILNLLSQEGVVPLDTGHINIDKNRIIRNQQIAFQIKLRPDYEPGVYKNTVIFTGENFKKEMGISFDIRPWRQIENGSTYNAVIDNMENRNHNLYSSGQQKIIIKSNCDWRLKVILDGDIDNNISILLGTDSESRQITDHSNEFINISQKEMLIAEGSKTTTLKSGQVEIYYQLKIEDFRKINAGKKSYQLNFILE